MVGASCTRPRALKCGLARGLARVGALGARGHLDVGDGSDGRRGDGASYVWLDEVLETRGRGRPATSASFDDSFTRATRPSSFAGRAVRIAAFGDLSLIHI